MLTTVYAELEDSNGDLCLVNPSLVAKIGRGTKATGTKYSILHMVGDKTPLWVRGAPREVANRLEKAYLVPPGVHNEPHEEAH